MFANDGVGAVRLMMLLGALVALSIAFLVTPADTQVPPAKPNLVFVLADDANYDDLILQENISALADRGGLFTDYHLTNAVCCPSRATYMTGEYSHNTGVTKNEIGGRSGWEVFKRRGHTEDWLPTLLQESGYRTALYGKLMNGAKPGTPRVQGFDRIVISDKPGEDGKMAARAAAFVRENADKGPVAVFYWPRSPHCPCNTPKAFNGDFDHLTRVLPPEYAEEDVSEKLGVFSRLGMPPPDGMRGAWLQHLEMTKRVDAGLGEIQDAVAEMNETENTVFAVSSDNGWFLGEHRIQRGKGKPYSAATHVPLVIAGPGVSSGTYEQLAGNHDFTPTMLALLGLAPREGVDGRDLFGPNAEREALLTEHPNPGLFVRGDKVSFPGYKAMRTDDGDLYIEWSNGHVEYYAEPSHTTPSEAPAGTSERLRALAECSGEACRAAEG